MGFYDRIRGMLGGGEPVLSERAQPRPDPSTIVEDLPLYLQIQRIGGALTPTQVSEILSQADTGYVYRLADLGNEARQKDGHLQSILGTREMALAALPWQLEPGGKRRKDRIAAEASTEMLMAFEDMPATLGHAIGANYFGYAVSELHYRKESGQLFPYKAAPIPPRRFVFNLADGRLRQWDATGGSKLPYPGIDLADHPGKFLVHQPRINGDVPAREGLSRVLVWAALFRNWTLRDWVALGEIAWKPWRRGTYKPGTDQKAIAGLINVLRRLSSTGIAVYEEGTKIDIDWPANPSAKSTHGELFSVVGSEMSKAVLGQTLTTEQGARGSQALGRVHDNVRRDILEFDARAVSAMLRRDLLTWFVRLNYGPDVAIPVHRFLTEESVDIASFGQGIKALRDAGLRIKATDVRSKVGLSEPEDGDELLGEDEVDIPIDPKTGLPAVPPEPDKGAKDEGKGDDTKDGDKAA